MALPGFRNHPKFRRLVAALCMPEAHVLGHVEMMWEVAYESGNAVLGDSVDVELAAGWIGEPGLLCRALAECGGKLRSGLIEEVGDGIWQVHDLLDHAPEYVDSRRKRLEEKGKDKVCAHCGANFRTADPKSRFCSDACRKADWRHRQRDARETNGDGTSEDSDGRGTDCDVRETKSPTTTSPDQPSPGSTTTTTTSAKCDEGLPGAAAPDPPPPATPADAVGAAPGKAKKKPKPRGRDFGIEALKMPPEEEAAFEKAWNGYPAKGWDFRTRREQPRRLNYAEAAKRFHEILVFTDILHDDGSRITGDELAEATLAFVAGRREEAKRQGIPCPCVPCIANFFSSCEGEKHPWKEALLRFFDAVPVGVPA